ncbi:hypothetical protein V7O66_12200 [Methanolobus sp. ZRKC3]|uniref:hypothetical protein n=1 Tax=Methanolobus sp. ZRKC3 TaxID=3125786 RepID=UPI003243E32E
MIIEKPNLSESDSDNVLNEDYNELCEKYNLVCAELEELKSQNKEPKISATLKSSYDIIEDKPLNIEEYKKWLKTKFGIAISNRTENHYNSVRGIISDGFKDSELWTELCQNLKDYDEKYNLKTNGYKLFSPNFVPELNEKTYESFILKTFRKNVVNNNNWPNEPEKGWMLPDNWYEKTGDIVRTLFVVKYLDGIEFLISIIKSVCKENGLPCEISFEAKDEGYYAAHIDIKQTFEIPKYDWDTKKIDVFIEIQITTQLQEVIRKLLHTYYEDKRISSGKQSDSWKWNYKSDEFAANYVGHILHYMEGMIMDIRNRKNKLSFQSGNEFAAEDSDILNLLKPIEEDSI